MYAFLCYYLSKNKIFCCTLNNFFFLKYVYEAFLFKRFDVEVLTISRISSQVDKPLLDDANVMHIMKFLLKKKKNGNHVICDKRIVDAMKHVLQCL